MLAVDDVADRIVKCFDRKESERLLFEVLSWGLEPRENLLLQLCEAGHERVAAHFMNNYPHLSDIQFFI